MSMRRLHLGLGAIRAVQKGDEIIVFFSPATSGVGGTAGIPFLAGESC